MAFYLSPLVDVNEIDLSTTIPAVATSIGVILLRDTYRGAELQKSFISTEDDLIEKFGKPTGSVNCYRDMLAAMGYLKYGNKLYCTRVMADDAAFAGLKCDASGTFTAFATPYALTDFASENPDNFHEDVIVDTEDAWIIGSSRGSWANNVRVAIINRSTYNVMATGGLDTQEVYPLVSGLDMPMASDSDFLVIVQELEQGDEVWTTSEVYNVSTKELAIDDQGVTRFVENVINQQSNLIRFALKEDMKEEDWTVTTESFQTLVSGSDGVASVSEGAMMEALDLYRNAEEIDVNILIDADKPLAVKRYMIALCEERKDCMTVLDCPYDAVVNNRGNETMDLRDWRMGLGSYAVDNLNENTSYAAVYGNWIELYDKYTRKYRWVPVSGHVAGIYAKTDDVNDAWWAPAGLNRAILTSVRRLAWNPDQGKRDILYKNGLNPLVSFAGQGKVIWGQKTLLDKSSAFNRVNVRRLFIVLEKAISTASKYFLFEPNDEVTRAQLTSMIEPFMRDVQARRGVYDFKVVCDESNNTPERIDRNELWCNIFIKPTRTAEFIVLNFVAMKTGASFEEAAAAVGG